MGVSKIENYTNSQNRIAELAKALAHPAKIAILNIIAQKKTCICNDIVEELPLSQASVSQHLKEMKRIGIITGKITPPKVCYCVNEVVLAEMKESFNLLFSSFTNGCC
jgi:ArsR family transcriptional regulator, arsenate/arsenite/antimonite-responsive transcriptional repressor